jgi:hypothetical protein
VVVFLGRANGSQKQRILQSNGIYERVLAEKLKKSEQQYWQRRMAKGMQAPRLVSRSRSAVMPFES